MYINFSLFIPILLILWIYILMIINKDLFKTNTSIEVNIIDNKRVLNAINLPIDEENINNSKKIDNKKIKYHIPKFMLELYERNKSAGKNDRKPDLVRSLIPIQTEKINDNKYVEEISESHLLIFDLPLTNQDEQFTDAELKILTQVEINSSNELGVKKTLKISIYNEINHQYTHLTELNIYHFNNTWMSFNLTNQVRQILQTINSNNKNLKIIITIISIYNNPLENSLKLSLLPLTENFDHDYPILLLTYTILNKTNDELINKRTKRSSISNIGEDYEEETNKIWNDDMKKKNLLKKYKKNNNCRRRPLYVNFAEIQYDLWIVQPSGYEAYQCQGKCFYPVAEHLSPTKHAIMQALIHSVNPSKATRSCCVPTQLDSISILYIDNNGVLTYRFAYKDMVVLECGCR